MAVVPVALTAITLAAAGAYGVSQYRKMKSQLPDDREAKPERKIARQQSLPAYDDTADFGERHTPPIGQ